MAQNPIVTFEIERESAFGPETGIIKAELYPEIAPNSVNNFISLIPLSVYLKGSRVTVKVGLCKGKKLYDKRQAAAERDAKRQIDRAMKERY